MSTETEPVYTTLKRVKLLTTKTPPTPKNIPKWRAYNKNPKLYVKLKRRHRYWFLQLCSPNEGSFSWKICFFNEHVFPFCVYSCIIFSFSNFSLKSGFSYTHFLYIHYCHFILFPSDINTITLCTMPIFAGFHLWLWWLRSGIYI